MSHTLSASGGRAVLVLALTFVLALHGTAPAQPVPPAPPTATAATGTIAGTVLDKSTGDPIIEAGVEVVGQGKTVRTDLDGKYKVRVPPGTYQVRIFAPLYQAVRLQNVQVRPNETANTNASLAPSGQAGVEVVEVVAQADRAAESAQLLQRKTASVVSDTLSAEVMKKTPGSDAADVVQRTPSVTVKDDKFIYVRGLSERYTSAMLNGSRLPSPDPLKRVVPLDLFPAEFLESIAIVKSYTPDYPGDFSGGLAEMRLRDFPDRLRFGLSGSIGGNTQTTGQEWNTYPGSRGDYFTLGSGFRRVPDAASQDLSLLSDRQRFAAGRDFKNIWEIDSKQAPPNYGAGLTVGNTWGPFGFQLGGVFSNEYKMRRDEIRRQYTQAGTIEDPDITLRDDFKSDVATFQSRLGGVLTAAYKPTDKHKLIVRSLINRNATDEVTAESGQTFNLGPGFVQEQTRLQYVEDELALGQVAGEHSLAPWLQLDWRSLYARTKRDEPDTRHTTYNGAVGGPLNFVEDSLGGVRLSNLTVEKLTDSNVDVTIPFKTWMPGVDFWSGLPAKFKFGPAYSFRDRDFEQRRIRFVVPGGLFDTTLPPETLLDPGNIGPGGVDVVEQTQPRDSFTATQEIAAAYGMFELPIVRDRLRVVGGARVEYSLIQMDTFDVLGDPLHVRKLTVDPLPGVNLIYSPRDDMNVRASWSESVSRPEFRELAPVEFPAQRGDLSTFGNPDLVQAEIKNYDLRWEWFFSPLEIVSLGFFYKDIKNQIEPVIFLQGSDPALIYLNADEATLIGFEFEGRKDLGFAHRHLKPFSLLANVTWADSEATIPVQRLFGVRTVQTNTSRPLQGQAPFIVNAAIEYDRPDVVTARLLYFTADDRISAVGSNGLPDIVEQRRDQIDAVVVVPLKKYLKGAPISMKLSAENITNSPIVFLQGDELQRRYTTGVKFSLGFSYTY